VVPAGMGGGSGGIDGFGGGPVGPTSGGPDDLGPGVDPSGGGETAAGGPASVGSGGTSGFDPGLVLASAMGVLGGAGPTIPLGVVATMVTTTGVVTAAMAFGMFGKRRRDGEQPAPDDVLAKAAATGLGVAVTGFATAPARAPIATVAPRVAPTVAPGPNDHEMDMPRWRRPSLIVARKADPIRDAPAPTPRLTFERGLVGPLDGHERRVIRYNVVRLLDSPDEFRGGEIGSLDQGDEVQLLEKHGVYWLVLCPDGSQGWIHKMTLGEVVGGEVTASAPTATMPIAADSWTMGDDVDGDVLAAYIESRRRA
jgi:hypothetical protein